MTDFAAAAVLPLSTPSRAKHVRINGIYNNTLCLVTCGLNILVVPLRARTRRILFKILRASATLMIHIGAPSGPCRYFLLVYELVTVFGLIVER